MLTKKAPEDGPARRFTDGAGEFETVIGPGARLKGEIEGETNVELRGRFEGPCRIEGLFWQREKASFRGELQATNVVLEGTFEGTVVATGKIELRSTARVYGLVQAKTMAVAEGCFFEGRVNMEKGGGEATHPTTFRETRGAGTAEEAAAAPEEPRPADGEKASKAAKEQPQAES